METCPNRWRANQMPEEERDWAVAGEERDDGVGGVGDQMIMELSAEEESSWRGLGLLLEGEEEEMVWEGGEK
jgi:hypothetical protein